MQMHMEPDTRHSPHKHCLTITNTTDTEQSKNDTASNDADTPHTHTHTPHTWVSACVLLLKVKKSEMLRAPCAPTLRRESPPPDCGAGGTADEPTSVVSVTVMRYTERRARRKEP